VADREHTCWPATATGRGLLAWIFLDDDVRHSNAHVASVSPHGHMRARLAKAFVRAHRSIIIDRAAAQPLRSSLIGIIADTEGACMEAIFKSSSEDR